MTKPMTPKRFKEIKETYRMVKSENASVYHPFLGDCITEIERLEQELSLEKANAEMRRKEILLGVTEIVRLTADRDKWKAEAERLIDIMAM